LPWLIFPRWEKKRWNMRYRSQNPFFTNLSTY